jgi:protein TonB
MRRCWVCALLCLGLFGCASTSRPPILTTGVGPVYPEIARVRQIEGFVTVAYDLTVEGKVVNARVIDAQPAQVFDSAALEAVRKWQFLPMRRDGRAIAVSNQRSTLTFKHDEGSRQYVEQTGNNKTR